MYTNAQILFAVIESTYINSNNTITRRYSIKKILDSIQWKLMFNCLILMLIPCLIIGVTSYLKAKQSMDDLGQTIVKNSVLATIQQIDSLNTEVQNGNLSLEDAQDELKEQILGKKKSNGKREIYNDIDLGINHLKVVQLNSTH